MANLPNIVAGTFINVLIVRLALFVSLTPSNTPQRTIFNFVHNLRQFFILWFGDSCCVLAIYV